MVKYAAGSMGGSYTLSYDIFSDNYSGGADCGEYQPCRTFTSQEVINDDGSSDYAHCDPKSMMKALGPAALKIPSASRGHGIPSVGRLRLYRPRRYRLQYGSSMTLPQRPCRPMGPILSPLILLQGQRPFLLIRHT